MDNGGLGHRTNPQIRCGGIGIRFLPGFWGLGCGIYLEFVRLGGLEFAFYDVCATHRFQIRFSGLAFVQPAGSPAGTDISRAATPIHRG